MQCPSCGTWYADNQAFCTACGDILSHGGHAAKLGDYRLIERIAEGGMGVVFHAFDEAHAKDVALKVLHLHMVGDPKHRNRFRREIRTHSQLRHPNILELHDVYEHENTLALVMELLDGCTLKDYLRFRDFMDLGEIITVAEAILTGLQYAHEQGVIHRDIKPSNIYLNDDGTVRLMDFGLAKSQKEVEDITGSGVAVGSYYYMAPEQILGRDLDARTDLYALGITIYQMATGRLPFTSVGGGEFEIMEKQIRHTPPPPDTINPAIDPKLTELILSLLEKDPDNRPADCGEVLDRLHRLGKATPLSLANDNDQRINRLSDLRPQKQKRQEDTMSGATSAKTAHKEAGPEESTLAWAFTSVSPEAPKELPLDLRSPPMIAKETLMSLRARISDIPPLPDSWYQADKILQDGDASPSDLAKILDENGPALGESILQWCNASGIEDTSGHEIANVALALTRIGMEQAHDILLQNSIPDFGALQERAAEVNQVWLHARGTSLLSRHLTAFSSFVHPRSASQFGMYHDIGKLVILAFEPEQKLEALRQSITSGKAGLKAEWEILGYTHIDAGMMLALHWRLPRTIHRFIYYHHHPCWHQPDIWPADMQPPLMLVHTAHLAMDAILNDSHGGLWRNEGRTHVPGSEVMMQRPLNLPVNDRPFFDQLRRDLLEMREHFTLLHPL
jgi:serine/threonine protein kinase